MKQPHKIIMLPSEKPSELKVLDGKPFLGKKELGHFGAKPQHLYILSDEEIKKGDWYFNNTGKAIECLKHLLPSDGKYCKKIIATTDPELSNLTCKNARISLTLRRPICNTIPCCAEFLTSKVMPLIPQDIIEAYVKDPFDKVMVEYWDKPMSWMKGEPNTYTKLNQDGTLAVSLVEEKMYSREEIEKKIDEFEILHRDGWGLDDFRRWIKENL